MAAEEVIRTVSSNKSFSLGGHTRSPAGPNLSLKPDQTIARAFAPPPAPITAAGSTPPVAPPVMTLLGPAPEPVLTG